MPFFNNKVFVVCFFILNSLILIVLVSSIRIRNAFNLADVVTVSIFSTNFFLWFGEHTPTWLIMYLYPIYVIVAYNFFVLFFLTQEDIEKIISLITKIFVFILFLLLLLNVLGFFFVLKYKLYVPAKLIRFCFVINILITALITASTLITVNLEQFYLDCYKMIRISNYDGLPLIFIIL